MLLATPVLFCQETIKPLYSIEVGYHPYDTLGFEDSTSYQFVRDSFFVNTYLGVQWYGFFLGGGVDTKMLFAGSNQYPINFNPYYVEFNIGVGWRLKGFEIKYEHVCGHPLTAWEGYQPAVVSKNYNMASDTISIRETNTYQ